MCEPRAQGVARARESALGYLPAESAFDATGLGLSAESLRRLFAVDETEWPQETHRSLDFLIRFGDRLPRKLRDEHRAFGKRLREALLARMVAS